MPRKLTVGIIGCGKIAHVDHVPNLLKVKNVAITGLYDILPERMHALKTAFSLDVQCHASLESLLLNKPDAVVVCTPNSLHYPQTMAALKARCHVLCEKPMAGRTRECVRMIQEARKSGRILHVNQTLHYLAPYVTLGKLVQYNKIGEVMHVRCLRFHTTSPDVGWSPGATWFVSKAFGGGIVMDIGVHMADMMKWLAGPAAEITAITETRMKHIDVVDNARALIQFESGATGVLELSWTSADNYGLVEVYGSNGVLRMGHTPDGRIELIQKIRGHKKKKSFPKHISKVSTSQQAFADAIAGKCTSPTPGELGRDAVALCEAILTSGQTHKPVKVKRFK